MILEDVIFCFTNEAFDCLQIPGWVADCLGLAGSCPEPDNSGEKSAKLNYLSWKLFVTDWMMIYKVFDTNT